MPKSRCNMHVFIILLWNPKGGSYGVPLLPRFIGCKIITFVAIFDFEVSRVFLRLPSHRCELGASAGAASAGPGAAQLDCGSARLRRLVKTVSGNRLLVGS